MTEEDRKKNQADLQLDELAKELETEDGRKRLGEDAFKEACEKEIKDV